MVKLIELIIKKPAMRILEFLFSNPTKEFSQTELALKLKIAKPTIINHLNFLEANGFVLTKRIGRTKLYKLNRTNFLIKQLKRVFNLTSPLIVDLQKKLATAKKIVVFGSYARGEDTEASDIDVLVITDVEKEKIQQIALNLSKKYGKKISAIVRTPEEYVRMPEVERELWERIGEGVAIHEA